MTSRRSELHVKGRSGERGQGGGVDGGQVFFLYNFAH